MGIIGIQELAIILVIAILIFGPKALPRLGKGAGEAIKEFRNMRSELESATDAVNAEVRAVDKEVRKL